MHFTEPSGLKGGQANEMWTEISRKFSVAISEKHDENLKTPLKRHRHLHQGISPQGETDEKAKTQGWVNQKRARSKLQNTGSIRQVV
jgi:hypothetical protein